jgi:hypothetical protein
VSELGELDAEAVAVGPAATRESGADDDVGVRGLTALLMLPITTSTAVTIAVIPHFRFHQGRAFDAAVTAAGGTAWGSGGIAIGHLHER